MENRVIFTWALENDRNIVEKIEKGVLTGTSIVWSFFMSSREKKKIVEKHIHFEKIW